MYRAKLTNWSVRTEETKQKYRQKKNEVYVSFAEGQACRRRTVLLLSMICTS